MQQFVKVQSVNQIRKLLDENQANAAAADRYHMAMTGPPGTGGSLLVDHLLILLWNRKDDGGKDCGQSPVQAWIGREREVQDYRVCADTKGSILWYVLSIKQMP